MEQGKEGEDKEEVIDQYGITHYSFQYSVKQIPCQGKFVLLYFYR